MDDNPLRVLTAHWKDLARRAYRDDRPVITDFLPSEDVPLADGIAARAGVHVFSWGGTENATRVMLSFSPFPVERAAYPLVCLTVSAGSSASISHRDVLGAVLALNLERDTIGDILIAPDHTQIFVCRGVAGVLLRDLRQVGSVRVSISDDRSPDIDAKTLFVPLKGTIASLRADTLVAFVTKQSRENAVILLRQGRVVRRHINVETPASPVQAGDVFSIRGYGKFRLEQVDGVTRKGRLHITVLQYR